MPRIRTIKPKFWDDIKLSKISRDARLLFIGIWNFSDDLGVIVAEPVWIKSKVFPYDKLEPQQFENWLNELISKKFIIPISHNDELFFFIRTFDRHQQINKPNHSDICIDKQVLTKLIEESRNNPVSIPEISLIDTVSIEGGKEGKGKEGSSKGKEGEFFFENLEKFLIPEMQKIWEGFKPNYPAVLLKDAPALQSIAVFICDQAGINYHKRCASDDKNLYELWGAISKFVATHDFYRKYNLQQVEKYIQTITQEIKNGKSGTTNGKSSVGKVNGEQLNQAFTAFYSQSK